MPCGVSKLIGTQKTVIVWGSRYMYHQKMAPSSGLSTPLGCFGSTQWTARHVLSREPPEPEERSLKEAELVRSAELGE